MTCSSSRTAGAKEMRLVVRPLTLPSYPLNVFWSDPAFHEGRQEKRSCEC